MRKLRTILQSNIFYIIIISFLIVYILIITKLIKYDSIYDNGLYNLTCEVVSLKKDNDKITLNLKCDEKVIAYYYLQDNEQIDILSGDQINIEGIVSSPTNNTIPNTFNYKKYLYNNKIYKLLEIKKIKSIKHNKNFFVTIKNKIYQRCYQDKYLSLFIIGDKSLLEEEIYSSYQNIGVAHLLAISGMHIGVLIKILKLLFKYIPLKYQNILIIIILFYYLYLVNYLVSVNRVIIFYILNLLNKKYNLNISSIKVLLLTSFILLFLNPFYIYNISFIYSFLAVIGVILSSRYNSSNYVKNLFIISFFTCIMTLPVSININYEINLILFVSNLILIPFITIVIFPFSLITFIFPFTIKVYEYFQIILEYIVNILNNITLFKFNIPKLSIIIIVIYYLIFYIFIKTNIKRYLLLFIPLFLIVILNKSNSLLITMFDVRQGDSISLIMPSKSSAILIDTGSNLYKNNLKNIIQYYKSKGIKKIDYLIISHGDTDHCGDTINLVNNFKVENVIFNCGEYNDLEKELIKVLEKKKIKYYSCIKELNIDNNKLYFLQTKVYDNENDNSNVIYFNNNNYKFLLMGDAGIQKEKDILNKYNLKDIDFLKVGHHGSNTSSSELFINSINPKYSLISVGKNNRYGHPKDEVLETLKNSKIYRTDIDGSIEIKLNKNGYKIRTCPP